MCCFSSTNEIQSELYIGVFVAIKIKQLKAKKTENDNESFDNLHTILLIQMSALAKLRQVE